MTITARIDGVTAIPDEFRKAVIPAPKSVKIELTSKCPYRCSFCANKDIQDKGEMDWATYTNVVDECLKAGVEEIGVFLIGESFMCDWLPDAIRYAKQAGCKYVFLTSNGYLCTPEKVRACMDAGLDSLKFSFNYSTPEQLKEIAGVKKSAFEKVISNIIAARKVRDEGNYKCRLYASSIKFEGEQMERMAPVLDRIKPYLDEAYFLPLFSFSDQKVVKTEEKLGFKPVAGNPGRAENMRDPLPCWSVSREMHIDRNGNLNACCFGGDDFIMGNYKDGVMNVWNNEKFQSLRLAHLAKDVSGTPCAKCAIGGY